MTVESPHIAVLQRYQEASNRHDIEGCVALFTADGRIEMDGQTYQGPQALRDAHAYDAGSRTIVAFRDFVVEGDLVRCTFWNEHELDRVLGTGGTTSQAAFAFRGQQIDCFTIMAPDEAERQRVMAIARPAFVWLRERHPDVVAGWGSFDQAGGDTVFAMAELWRARDEASPAQG